MSAILARTGSLPVQRMHLTCTLKPVLSLHQDSSSSSVSPGEFSSRKRNDVISPSTKLSVHSSIEGSFGYGSKKQIRRVSSESTLIQGPSSQMSRNGSASFFDDLIREEEEEQNSSFSISGGLGGSLWPEDEIAVDEIGVSIGDGSGGGGRGGRSEIGAYYEQMLKSNPGNALILRNYGRYLHEVEKDTVRAEECYGRAILASPGDGELLALYGKLIWETQRDQERAQSYFDHAVAASPDDCMVLGSYANFLWESEEDE